MTKKTFIMAIMAAIIVAACGTVRLPGVPGVGGSNVRARATRTPAPTVGALDPSASTQTAFTPIPTYDVVSKLVTQAYALYTPTPGAPATKAPTAAAGATAAPLNTGAVAPAPTAASGGVIIAPSSVIVNETVNFANFTNTATCGIKLIGDCTTVMKPNQDIYMTWKFTNNSTRTFNYGDASVTIVRDGQAFANMQTINGATRILPPDKDAKWELKVGDTAEFRAGVDKIQAGSYNARLMICTNVPADCRAGNGWQFVGGSYVNFTVAP
ncbi:MAG: hypothetical protein HZC38_07895 [Chloroflexi bacterium]|nr:hypothetical protein [Chloroflexota bacterium]MBI5713331.1 hypothetical protein [Chloroflexota bacterium]